MQRAFCGAWRAAWRVCAGVAVLGTGCLFDASLSDDAVITCASDDDCLEPARCIPAGRCSASNDRTPPTALSLLVSPEHARIGDLVVVDLTASEPLAQPPNARFESGDELFSVGEANAARDTFSLWWLTRGDEVTGEAVAVRVRLVDDYGNPAELEAGTVTFDFTEPVCGDGVHEWEEACDDGNRARDDGCDDACRVEPGFSCSTDGGCTTLCGDGVVAGVESCDDGDGAAVDGCGPTCTADPGFVCTGSPSVCALTCGNDVANVGEQCDDGGFNPGDGCDSNCRVEDGYVCPQIGFCAAQCGDGDVRGTEPCDDGNVTDGDGCAANCRVEPGFSCTRDSPSACSACGDGIAFGGEECDDGNTVDADGCSRTCTLEPGYVCGGSPSICADTCSNGSRDPGESCDDLNLVSGDGCTPSCANEEGWLCPDVGLCETACSDGLVRGDEQCDDGNLEGGDGCDANCTTEPGVFCRGEPSVCALGCTIGDTVFGDGDPDPTNTCRTCQVAVTTSSFTPLAEGSTCSDGVFCNGAERCTAGVCVGGATPCAGQTPVCDEALDRCECSAGSCNDALFCNGAEQCNSGICQSGAAPLCIAPTDTCSEIILGCLECETDVACGPGAICDSNGRCVAGEPCPLGRARTYRDFDGDGYGTGLRDHQCFQTPPPPGRALQTGDCNDDDASVYRLISAYPDGDADGFTAAGISGCYGDILPDGMADTAVAPPLVSFMPGASGRVAGPGAGTWSAPSAARLPDGTSAHAGPNVTTEYLVVNQFGLQVSGITAVRGVVVRVRRSASVGAVQDASVRLVVGGEVGGAEHARPGTPWPAGFNEAVYGAEDDSWGLTLTPAMVASAGFGVALAATVGPGGDAAVDSVNIEIHVEGGSGVDCDDADGTAFSSAPLFVDRDADGYTLGAALIACVGSSVPAGRRASTLGADCFDENQQAFPGSNTSSSSHRGDGSYDYDCDGVQQKLPLEAAVSCQCNPCRAVSTVSVVPAAPCGGTSSVQGCSGGNCGHCDEQLVSTATRCH